MSGKKSERSELHPEVEKILLGEEAPPNDAEWRFSRRVLGRAVHPALAKLFISVRKELERDTYSFAKMLAQRHNELPQVKDLISESEILEMAEELSNLRKEEFTRLKDTFTAAVVCADSVFFSDLTHLNKTLKEAPSTSESLHEFFRYSISIKFLQLTDQEVTAGAVKKALERDFDFFQALDTVRNRLKRDFGLSLK